MQNIRERPGTPVLHKKLDKSNINRNFIKRGVNKDQVLFNNREVSRREQAGVGSPPEQGNQGFGKANPLPPEPFPPQRPSQDEIQKANV